MTIEQSLTQSQGQKQTVDVLLDELDLRAVEQEQESQNKKPCQRRAPRKPFRVPCTVRFLPMSTWVVSELPGRTRNISRGGLGIIVRRTFAVGEAIEVEIESQERGPFFMAGRVAFCRYAGQTYYEVGIALKSAQASPIFSVNPALAFEMLHWLELPAQSPPNKPQ